MQRNTIKSIWPNEALSSKWFLALCAALCITLASVCWAFTIDDAWIVARYAKNIVIGAGYAFNPHLRSDGVTGPLWIVPMITAEVLGLDPINFAKIASITSSALAVAMAAHFAAYSVADSHKTVAAILVVLGCACEINLWVWSSSGLETGLATLTLSVVIFSALRSTPYAGLCLGLANLCLAWLRPECLLCGFVALLILLSSARKHRIAALGLSGIGVLSVAGFRVFMFGQALPLSIQAKPFSLLNGLRYSTLALGVLGLGLGMMLIAILAKQRKILLLGLILLATHCIAVLAVGGDWMPGFRLFVPILPAFCAFLSIAVIELYQRRDGLAGCPCLGMVFLLPIVDSTVQLPRIAAAAHLQSERASLLGRYLSQNVKSAALVDIGLVGYQHDLFIVDLAGLTDPVIAMQPGAYLGKRLPIAHLDRKAPQAIVLRTRAWHKSWQTQQPPPSVFLSAIESNLARHPWFRHHYRFAKHLRYRKGYHYLVYLQKPQR
ncbi:MAG: hypothetical protein IPJ88_11610 [Myxococcales bacterium]|nr:MAG: hypothetical protein IPJ88_11610 [Myxococcales bacterium]